MKHVLVLKHMINIKHLEMSGLSHSLYNCILSIHISPRASCNDLFELFNMAWGIKKTSFPIVIGKRGNYFEKLCSVTCYYMKHYDITKFEKKRLPAPSQTI